jgi:hypothetical protein
VRYFLDKAQHFLDKPKSIFFGQPQVMEHARGLSEHRQGPAVSGIMKSVTEPFRQVS